MTVETRNTKECVLLLMFLQFIEVCVCVCVTEYRAVYYRLYNNITVFIEIDSIIKDDRVNYIYCQSAQVNKLFPLPKPITGSQHM